MGVLVNVLHDRNDTLLAEPEAIYKDPRQHLELSMQEVQTAKTAVDHIEAPGYEVTRDVGITGTAGVSCSGDGPMTVLRADMDALPMAENTDLPYASTVRAKDEEGVGVDIVHSCEHDMHVIWLIDAVRILAKHCDARQGAVMVAFQPGEKVRRGATSMVDDWGTERSPKPNIIPGQHIMVGASGTVSHWPGVILLTGDSLKIRLFGHGSHGSQLQTSIDPAIMATFTTLRLQTIVSCEISPMDNVMLTIGTLQASTKENTIPDEVIIKLSMRTFDEDVREYMLTSIKRIRRTECDASNAKRPPEFTTLSAYPLTENDTVVTQRLTEASRTQFDDKVCETKPASANENFSIFGRAWNVSCVFWLAGRTDPQIYAQTETVRQVNKISSNHSPKFAPVIHPTLETGLYATLTATPARLYTSPAIWWSTTSLSWSTCWAPSPSQSVVPSWPSRSGPTCLTFLRSTI